MNPESAARQSTSSKVVSIKSATRAAPSKSFDAQTTGGDAGGDTWKHSVEARLSELRSDVRNLLIAGIIACVALIGVGWTVYNSAIERLTNIAIEQQNLSGKIDTMDARINGKIETLGQRVEDRTPAAVSSNSSAAN